MPSYRDYSYSRYTAQHSLAITASDEDPAFKQTQTRLSETIHIPLMADVASLKWQLSPRGLLLHIIAHV
jgi:hypothetical protein